MPATFILSSKNNTTLVDSSGSDRSDTASIPSSSGPGDGVVFDGVDSETFVAVVASGSEFRVNTYTVGQQSDSSVDGLFYGGFIVTWSSVGQDGSGSGIYGQRYDLTGRPIDNEFMINVNTSGDQVTPVVTHTYGDDFFVTWETAGSVRGRVFETSTNEIHDEFQIGRHATGNRSDAAATLLTGNGGGLIVAFAAADQAIWDQRFDPFGGYYFVGRGYVYDTRVSAGTIRTEPSITSLDAGRFVVVWTADEQGGNSTDIFGRLYRDVAQPINYEFRINSYTDGAQSTPVVETLNSGGFVVVWSSYGQDGDALGVFGQLFGADGSPIAGEFQVNTTNYGNQDRPAVTALADGGFLVAWSSHGQDGDGWGVYGQRYSSDGEAIGAEFVINTTTAGDQQDSAVTSLRDGRVLVTWTTSVQDGDATDVVGQLFDVISIDPENSPVVGEVVINGTLREGETVSVDASGLSDADGLGELSYQWRREGDDISGAIGASYTLTPQDAGRSISVRVSYVDGLGHQETVLGVGASPVENVNNPVQGAPLILGEQGQNISHAPTASVGETLLAYDVEISDPDGIGFIFFEWFRDGAFILGQRGVTYTVVSADDGADLSVRAYFMDQGGTLESVFSAPVAIISNGTNQTGTAGNDLLQGASGADTLNGLDGSDTLIGNDGDDLIFGGETEADLRDAIYGGDGNDSIDGGYGNDELRGDGDSDTIVGGFGVDSIFGGAGDDVLAGQAWSDLIYGNDGNDFINGGFGFDRVNGGAGADWFYHLGIRDHGSDWIQDYDAAEGDVLLFGNASATESQFQINYADSGSGDTGVDEAFIIYRPSGQIMWALVDGAAQTEINIVIQGTTFDLMS
ncbi:hypothetical protein [Thalassovita sp.]|uniref:hypothetical protein n=1 Tax=Thalassovita sp. TaxID=1979401 RepID=UPI002B268302|nr:hypothetical protein [Thalassovita sp.]